MVPMVMSPATPIPFSRYSGFDRHGISPIGAIAAAPMSYRVIAKLRHRKLSATLMAPRFTQLVGLTRARGQWRIRRRRISISRLSDRRRGGGPGLLNWLASRAREGGGGFGGGGFLFRDYQITTGRTHGVVR